MPVVDKKTSRGVTYVIVENCLNGFQKPAIAAMLRRAVGPDAVIAPQEPLFTREDACTVTSLGDLTRTETVHLVGNLCCALDVLQEGFTGPALEIGDLVAVSNAGAYACTLSVQRFSSHHRRRSCWWTGTEMFCDNAKGEPRGSSFFVLRRRPRRPAQQSGKIIV